MAPRDGSRVGGRLLRQERPDRRGAGRRAGHGGAQDREREVARRGGSPRVLPPQPPRLGPRPAREGAPRRRALRPRRIRHRARPLRGHRAGLPGLRVRRGGAVEDRSLRVRDDPPLGSRPDRHGAGAQAARRVQDRLPGESVPRRSPSGDRGLPRSPRTPGVRSRPVLCQAAQAALGQDPVPVRARQLRRHSVGPRACLELGELYRLRGKPQEAEPYYRRLLRDWPNTAESSRAAESLGHLGLARADTAGVGS